MARPVDLTQSYDARPSGGAGPSAHNYLLVIDGASSRRQTLPREGVLILGRAEGADIRIDSAGVSRQHARILVADGEIHIVDAGSHNGTVVNGELLKGTRSLASGDAVTIGATTLVLRCEPRGAVRAVVDPDRLRQRFEAEIERAGDYARPLAVLVVALGGAHAAAGVKASGALRLMDVLGWDEAASLVALLPELGGEAALSAARDLLAALAPLGIEARCGLAAYPSDGCDTATLLAGARAAVAAAAPGAVALAAETAVRHSIGDQIIVAADPAMIRLFDLVRRLAASDLPVLVLGETGAGKENAAAAVHHWSPRACKSLVTLNCAALPESLIESELFGYEKGAFSDARAPKPGLLERADGGSVFLDEVGELSLGAQAKLLRALEAKRITRLGDVREREVDFRIVAATNRDLEAESRAGRFRSDLLFRLSVAVVALPPLRDRPREVLILARLFLEGASARAGRAPLELSDAALLKLASYPWPGNVRELKSAMSYAAATAESAVVEPWNLPARVAQHGLSAPPPEPAAPPPDPVSAGAAPTPRRFQPIAEELRALERTRMQEALEETGGIQTRAAELISMPIRTFALKIKQYGITAREVKRRA